MASNKKTFESLIKEKLDSYEMQYNHSDWLKLEKDLPSGQTGSSWTSSGSILKIAAIVGITAIAVVSLVYILNKTNPVIKSDNIQKVSTLKTNINNTQPNSALPETNQKLTEQKQNVVQNNSNKKEYTHEIISAKVNSNQNTIINTTTENNNQEIKNSNKSENTSNVIQNGNYSTPVIMFSVDKTEGCTPLKVTFVPSQKNDQLEYMWDFGNGETSTNVKPTFTYETEGTYTTKLTVTNKKTHQSSTFNLEQPIVVKQSPIADFSYENNNNTFTFTSRAINASKIKWQLGNGEESTDWTVKQIYKVSGPYNISLIATGFNGCITTSSKEIIIDVFSHIYFPEAFTPNGDGRSDYFGPIAENLSEYQYEIEIYNRFGHQVFETKDCTVQWDGKIKGTEKLAEPGVYAYIAIFKDKYGNAIKKNGHVVLIIK